MADWTQIYQNPQTQALFGGAIPPIPSPSVQPIGGWGNVDLTQAMTPQQPQRPQMPVQAPSAPQGGQDGSMGIGQLLMMILPMLLAGGTRHPNNARSAYMRGIMGQMQQQKQSEQQRLAEQQARQMEEQKRIQQLNADFAKEMVKNDPSLISDTDFLSAWQSGQVIEWAKQSGWKPRATEEETDPWKGKKVVGGNVVSFDAEGNPVVNYSAPDKPEKVDRTKYTGKFTDEDGVEWAYNPENPDDRKRLGKGKPEKGLTRADKDAIWRTVMGGTDLLGNAIKGLVNMNYKSPEAVAQAVEQYYGEGTPEYEHAMNIAFNDPTSKYKGKDPRNASQDKVITKEEYEYLKSQGFTDEQMIAEGYVIPQ